MSTNLAKPLRLRNDGGAQLQLERSGTARSLTVNASGNLELDGTFVPTALTTATATITGGSINGTPVGGTTAAAGAFTTLTASSTATLNTLASSGATITGGSINGTPIGGTTASTGAFSNLSYTGTLTGGTGVVNLGSGQLYKDASGNVGIGTASPYNNLEASASGGASIGISNSLSGAGILYGKLAFYSTVAAGAFAEFGGQIRSYSGVGIDYGDLRFYTADGAATAERLRIDSAGNVGIGVTPSAWGSNAKALQITQGPSTGALASVLSSDEIFVLRNARYDGSDFRYVATGPATSYQQASDASHRWANAPSGTAGNAITFTQRLSIANDGTIQLPSGTPGIKFGTRNANLADYEEGTWTPTLTSSGATFTYSNTDGQYRKIGRQVTVAARVQVASLSGTTSNPVTITGLPFTSTTAALFRSAISLAFVFSWAINSSDIQGLIGNNQTSVGLLKNASNAAASDVLASDIGSAGVFVFTATYFVD